MTTVNAIEWNITYKLNVVETNEQSSMGNPMTHATSGTRHRTKPNKAKQLNTKLKRRANT
jgi:hypothetical protein